MAEQSDEFFSVGQPLHAVRASYVKRRADDVLFDTIMGGRYAHLVAPDRSGKSSLIAATAARLEANGFRVAVLDLQQIGVRDGGTDAGRWYYSVAYRLLRQLRIRIDLQSWWQDKSILSNRQRLVEFYSEIILGNVADRIVVFVDEIQCVAEMPFADQLLASIRAAHNARTTDPEFSRLTFVLLGECDPDTLVSQPEASPFQVTQSVALGDFTRADLNLFTTELGLSPADAELALDRIYYWTSGQPYLSQKLARAVKREAGSGDVVEVVDRIVTQQLAGRAATHNEPHMGHVHRMVVNHPHHREALLNLYGRVRKGIEVGADLGSPLQRYLIAIGLLIIDDDRCLAIRNRLYAAVFTTRWANENLPAHWRGPAIAALLALVMVAVPFWYTQLLPRGYVEALTSTTIDLDTARSAYTNFRSFPGHADTADNLYRGFLQRRAGRSADTAEILQLSAMANDLPEAGRLAEELQAGFWDRRTRAAMQAQRRDEALAASLQSLILATTKRRQKASMLIADDYPLLQQSLPFEAGGQIVFDAANMTLTRSSGAVMSQWNYDGQQIVRNDDWSITALEVTPLVRRVVVDQGGQVARIGLTLNVAHARMSDLRIKVIAPSGRTIDIDTGLEQASSVDDIRIPASQLRDLLGESINGTWSLSVRDEALGVAGHLVGWNLKLNSQGVVEDFERGLNIPDPVERETDNIWFSDDGRYAVARALQSDSARVWDLAFGKPIRAVAVGEAERIVGVDAGARRLATATQDTVHLWDLATGTLSATLQVGAASSTAVLTADGLSMFAQRRGDADTQVELWSLEQGLQVAAVTIAGTPALVSINASGSRVAVADYDRAVRVWDMSNGELLAQFSMGMQPSRILLGPRGETLGAVYGTDGASLWRVDRPLHPLFEKQGPGRWQLEFSPSGASVLAGTAEHGFQVFRSEDGSLLGPLLGAGNDSDGGVLAFSADEQTVVTGAGRGGLRFWRVPVPPAVAEAERLDAGQAIWSPSGDRVIAVADDASIVAIGDRSGDVHILPVDTSVEALHQAAKQVRFLGHSDEVRLLRMSRDNALVASAAADNTVRVWNTAAGDPRPFESDIPGNPVTHIDFSPGAELLAVLNGNRAQLLDTGSGEVLAGFELGENHEALAFATDDRLYLGADSGALRLIQRGIDGNWSLQQLRQGSAAVRWLEASPEGDFLVVVDADNRASQFNLVDGQPGGAVLELPQPVDEVRFSPGGSRVTLRASRWIHRASSSGDGLRLLDTVYGPGAISGARMVFGPSPDPLGNRLYLPIAGSRFVRLEPVWFANSEKAGLLGGRDELLNEWQERLALVATQGPDE
ncbi:MAG: AAA-like domain-containing protein [Woeseiaceae bacterium]|nr:AAA-like domain-containing protein [Woeseiaceae bacterium]